MNLTEFLIIFAESMLDRIILFPYTAVLGLRSKIYRRFGRKSCVPTICIGNVTVGGTGKTPHTEMILELLQHSNEWGAKNIAVLSRGYGRRTRGFQYVVRDGKAMDFGDEPMQIKRKFPAVTVAVDRNRLEGCSELCRTDNPDSAPSDLVILDDAYQYIKLKADVNIVLVDYNRPVDKDHLLPFGSLRDLPSRVKDADILIVTKCPYEMDDDEKFVWAYRLGVKDKSKMFFTTIVYDPIVPLFSGTDIRYIFSKKAILFTGVARGNHLYRHLSDTYKVVGNLAYPDHHKYNSADFRRLENLAAKEPTAVVVTTEKDAQRVLDLNCLSRDMQKRLFYNPIKVGFFSEKEKERFAALLLSVLSRNSVKQ